MSESVILWTSHVNGWVRFPPSYWNYSTVSEQWIQERSSKPVGLWFLCRLSFSLACLKAYRIFSGYQKRLPRCVCTCWLNFFCIACKYAFSLCSLQFSTQKRFIIIITILLLLVFLLCAVFSLENSLHGYIGCPGFVVQVSYVCFLTSIQFWESLSSLFLLL